jgi:hypothetical protein
MGPWYKCALGENPFVSLTVTFYITMHLKKMYWTIYIYTIFDLSSENRGRRGCDRLVFRFTTTCAINTYHHWSFELESCLATTLCDSLLVSDRWFSPGIPVSFTNKTDHCDITEIWLKVELNTINLTLLNYMAL